jgi:uncharacterized phiE125 gp8 family phage protein
METPPFPAAVLEAARDAAKARLRDARDDEDALIETMAASALALGEAFTGSAWIAREGWQTMLPVRGEWQVLETGPVTAITAVEGVSAAGDLSALAADAYAIDIDADGRGWVRVSAPGDATRLRVTYAAGGVADWADLPAPLAQGVVLLAAHLFETRGEVAAPAAVAALWRPWRRMRLQAARR